VNTVPIPKPLEDFLARYPRYRSLLGVVPSDVILRIVVPKAPRFESLVRESSGVIPRVNLADVFGEAAEQGEIVLRRFLGEWGNVTVEECAKLALIVRAHAPMRLLEVGTFNGMTTLQLAINAPPGGVVYTIDLGELDAPAHEMDEIDALVFQRARRAAEPGAYFADIPGLPIVQLRGDSARFDFAGVIGDSVDFIFIDGGHSYAQVKADTERLLPLLSDRGVLLWHNYHDLTCPDVTAYLLDLARTLALVQLRNTNLVCYRR